MDSIYANLERGAVRSAQRDAERLRRSMAGRYLAIWRSKPRNLIDRASDPMAVRDQVRSERMRQTLSLLERVGDLSERARATVLTKAKNAGPKAYRRIRPTHLTDLPARSPDRRIIFQFGWIDRARQRLIAQSLMPFANYHPSQFLLRQGSAGRGRSAVCRFLRQQVPTLCADHVFMQVDVRDFFGSISTAWIERFYRLPVSVIRRHMHSGEMDVRVIGRARAYLRDGENNERVRQVLAQGSALSSMIAEQAMAYVLEELSDRLPYVLLATYSDYLGIFLPQLEAAALEDLLRRTFGSSDAGPFELQFSKPVPISKEFRFLGYHWRLIDGELCTYVPEPVAETLALSIVGDMASTLDRGELHKIKRRIRSLANEWKFWPGVAEWQADLMRAHAAALAGVTTAEASLAQAA